MKILLLGDASHYHATLAQALKAKGHDVTVASDHGGWMRTPGDVSLTRPLPGRLGGAWLYGKMLYDPRLTRGYDVVQLVGPAFVKLHTSRLRKLFDGLRRRNGSVWVTALAPDTPYIEMCLDPDGPLRYNEWMSKGQHTPYHLSHYLEAEDWLSPHLRDLCHYVYDRIDGVISDLYEYHLSSLRWLGPSKVHYAGIPIDMAAESPFLGHSEGPLKLSLPRHSRRKQEKGTDLLERAARAVVSRHPETCTLDIIEDLPYEEYLKHLRDSDVVLDQVYSYTPATNALLAMSMGKVVLSGGEPEYYDFISEKELHPIVNALPDVQQLIVALEGLLRDRDRVRRLQVQGPEFVRRHNDAAVVAQRFLDIWQS